MKDLTNKSVSRRTVAKGAAWAVPAIAVGSAAAAEQASPPPDEDPIVQCPTEPENLCWYAQGADVISATRWKGSDAGKGSGRNGSYFNFHLGTWQFDTSCMPQARYPDGTEYKITGYRVNWPTGKDIVIRGVREDSDGTLGVSHKWAMGHLDPFGNNTWVGHFTDYPNQGPLVVGAGLLFRGGFQSDLPYSGFAWDPEYQLGTPGQPYRHLMVSMPISITFLKGLKPIIHSPGEDACAPVYINLVFRGGPGGATFSCMRQNGIATGPHEMWISDGLPSVPEV